MLSFATLDITFEYMFAELMSYFACLFIVAYVQIHVLLHIIFSAMASDSLDTFLMVIIALLPFLDMMKRWMLNIKHP